MSLNVIEASDHYDTFGRGAGVGGDGSNSGGATEFSMGDGYDHGGQSACAMDAEMMDMMNGSMSHSMQTSDHTGHVDYMTLFPTSAMACASSSSAVTTGTDAPWMTLPNGYPVLHDATNITITTMLQNDYYLNQWQEEYSNIHVTYGMMETILHEEEQRLRTVTGLSAGGALEHAAGAPVGETASASELNAAVERQRMQVEQQRQSMASLARQAEDRIQYIRSLAPAAAEPMAYFEQHVKPLADQLKYVLTCYMDAMALSTQQPPIEVYQHDVTAALLCPSSTAATMAHTIDSSGGGNTLQPASDNDVLQHTLSQDNSGTHAETSASATLTTTAGATMSAPESEPIVSAALTLRKPAVLELNGQRLPRRKAAWEQRRPMQKYRKVPHLAWGAPYNYVEFVAPVDPRQARVMSVGGMSVPTISLCGNVVSELSDHLLIRLPPLAGADPEHSSTSAFPGMSDVYRFPRDRISNVQWMLPYNDKTGKHDVPPTPIHNYRLIPPDDVAEEAILHVALLEREFLVPVMQDLQNDSVVKVTVKGFPSLSAYNEFISDRERVPEDMANACLPYLDLTSSSGSLLMTVDNVTPTEATLASAATTTTTTSTNPPMEGSFASTDPALSATYGADDTPIQNDAYAAPGTTTTRIVELSSRYNAEQQKVTLHVPGRWLIQTWHLFESHGYLVRQKAIARRKLAVRFLSLDEMRKQAEEYVDSNLLLQMIDSIAAASTPEGMMTIRTNHEQLVQPLSQPLRSFVIEEMCKRNSPIYTREWINSHVDQMRTRGPSLTPQQHIQALDAYFWARMAVPRQPDYEKYERVLEFYKSAGLDVYLKKPYQRTGENRGRSSASGLLRTMRGIRARIYSGASPHVMETDDGQQIAKTAHPRQSKSKYNPGMLEPAPMTDTAGAGNGPVNLTYNFAFHADEPVFDPSDLTALLMAVQQQHQQQQNQQQQHPPTASAPASAPSSGFNTPDVHTPRHSITTPSTPLSSWFDSPTTATGVAATLPAQQQQKAITTTPPPTSRRKSHSRNYSRDTSSSIMDGITMNPPAPRPPYGVTSPSTSRQRKSASSKSGASPQATSLRASSPAIGSIRGSSPTAAGFRQSSNTAANQALSPLARSAEVRSTRTGMFHDGQQRQHTSADSPTSNRGQHASSSLSKTLLSQQKQAPSTSSPMMGTLNTSSFWILQQRRAPPSQQTPTVLASSSSSSSPHHPHAATGRSVEGPPPAKMPRHNDHVSLDTVVHNNNSNNTNGSQTDHSNV